MLAAASFYHLPPRVLPSIQAVEGGWVGAVHTNADGTADLGVMQVNTRWVQPLAQVAAMPPAVVKGRLVNDPCFNVAAAALILRAYLREAHGDLYLAVGLYHSHTASLRSNYLRAVLARARALFTHAR
jgi:hypothetical protein